MDIYRSRIPNKIDAHTHMFADTDAILVVMDRLGVGKAVVLAVGMDNPEALAYNEALCFKHARNHPDRLAVMATFDLSAIDDANYAERQTERLERVKDAGAVGVKVSKELGLFALDRLGNLIVVDDPRLDPIWDKAGELNLPVLMHAGDPPAYWRPVDENNPWRVLLGEMTNWSYHGREKFPTFQELMQKRNNVLRNHPDTTFIGAHLGSEAWDMSVTGVAALLDEFPNLAVDASAVVDEVGRHPRETREFFLKYADRILHGTDIAGMTVWDTTEEVTRWADELARNYSKIFRFYETSDTMPAIDSRTRDWTIKGIDLPDEALRKIYHDNACRIIPGLSRPV